MTQSIYAIGDIHGELSMLEDAISRVESDGGADAHIVFLGDYVDRGPNSREVIDLLMQGLSSGKNWQCLLGNHDRMLTMFMEDYPRADTRFRPGMHWLHERIGGKETLSSYGVEIDDDDRIHDIHQRARTLIPAAHIDFLRARPYFYQLDELLFVHAGIRPGVAFEQQDQEDLLWIREEFHDDKRAHPWLVVHGHTPIDAAQHYGNRVNLDTGAGYGDLPSAAVFEGVDCWLLTEAGRKLLVPLEG